MFAHYTKIQQHSSQRVSNQLLVSALDSQQGEVCVWGGGG
jgi:hypothetical protein